MSSSLKRYTAEVVTLADSNTSVASVQLLEQTGLVDFVLSSATGSSKREPGDVYDEGIAFDLAVGRALVNLGYELIDRAEAKVKRAAEDR